MFGRGLSSLLGPGNVGLHLLNCSEGRGMNTSDLRHTSARCDGGAQSGMRTDRRPNSILSKARTQGQITRGFELSPKARCTVTPGTSPGTPL